ncbi:hypothetical protein [Streptomyces sp. NPDC006355]
MALFAFAAAVRSFAALPRLSASFLRYSPTFFSASARALFFLSNWFR